MSEFTANVIHPNELTARDRAAWRSFAASNPLYDSPFLQPGFAEAVGRVRSDVRVSIVRRPGAAIAFLPFQHGWGGYARPIGAPFCDVQGLIAEDNCPLTLEDVVALSGLTAFRFTGAVAANGEIGEAHHARGAVSLADLSATGGFCADSRGRLFPAHAKSLRRRLRKAEREVGPVDLIFPDRDPAHLDLLLRWKRAQYRRSRLHDVLQPAWATHLMRALFSNERDGVAGRLATLTIGGEPAAMEFNLCTDAVMHGWIVAYDSALAPFSPGTMLLDRLYNEIPAQGFRRYVLGCDAADYMRPYTSLQIPIFNGIACGSTFAGRTRSLSWAAADAFEATNLGGVSRLFGRTRRRLEQIAAAETKLGGRLRGAATALGSQFSGKAKQTGS